MENLEMSKKTKTMSETDWLRMDELLELTRKLTDSEETELERLTERAENE